MKKHVKLHEDERTNEIANGVAAGLFGVRPAIRWALGLFLGLIALVFIVEAIEKALR